MAGGIFISYRRDDSRHFAGRLFDSISSALPDVRVFMDVGSIPFGENFVDVLNKQLKSCQALLVVIGPNWLKTIGGRTNLDDPNDWVRLEIETAMRRKIRIFPVLLDNAEMPAQDQIPESLSSFREYQFIRIDHENYSPIVKELVSQLSERVKPAPPKAPAPLTEQLDHPAEPVCTNASTTNDAPFAGQGRKLLETAISELRTGKLRGWAWVFAFLLAIALWIFLNNAPKSYIDPALERVGPVIVGVMDKAKSAGRWAFEWVVKHPAKFIPRLL